MTNKDKKELIFETTKNSRAFEVEDTFNPPNVLKGFIHKTGNSTYGALIITHINGIELDEPHQVYAMPKLQYPADKRGKTFTFPHEYDQVLVYEKLDGTNIFAYKYPDPLDKTKSYVTYKTRLTPVVKGNSFGEFGLMWQKMLKKYPGIPQFVKDCGYNVAFEMYGLENPILIRYPGVELDTKILLLRNNDTGAIYAPTRIKEYPSDVPSTPTLITTIKHSDDIKRQYLEIVEFLDGRLQRYKEFENEVYTGLEGTVWYPVNSDNELIGYWNSKIALFKCKPSDIREIHYKEGLRNIPRHSIFTTIINAWEELESDQIPTVEHISTLLLEEFTQELVAKAQKRIYWIIQDVLKLKQIRNTVYPIYIEAHGKDPTFDITKDKGKVMRFFSDLIKRGLLKPLQPKDIRLVFNELNNRFGV